MNFAYDPVTDTPSIGLAPRDVAETHENWLEDHRYLNMDYTNGR